MMMEEWNSGREYYYMPPAILWQRHKNRLVFVTAGMLYTLVQPL